MSKFLTFEDRLSIARGLREQLSFGEIGKELSKDRTTIAKEIKRYSIEQKGGDFLLSLQFLCPSCFV